MNIKINALPLPVLPVFTLPLLRFVTLLNALKPDASRTLACPGRPGTCVTPFLEPCGEKTVTLDEVGAGSRRETEAVLHHKTDSAARIRRALAAKKAGVSK